MIKYAIIGAAIVIGAIIFSSCKAAKTVQTEATTCAPVLLDRDLYTKGAKRADGLIRITSATIEGDCLTIGVESAICKNDLSAYQLVWNEVMMKSMPPQVNVVLFADNQEKCETPQSLTLKYDLKVLQKANPRGKVIVRLRGHKERLDYSFGTIK
jgi:hypothetical protein